ncbi:hypothetical protein Xhom_04876 [Xenorhabdus hominickii]|uniref:Uncharacterized protein n=1 Tax=Xenorhabdus hominickii TaxID=351679 RepID=A0A1V0M4I4_XENHO|nr:hypothetical protein [Xenorhabdus hominickii]PHM51584.1 hypothetical protein Xhom_04876 [Xenorhabdus hominickii]
MTISSLQMAVMAGEAEMAVPVITLRGVTGGTVEMGMGQTLLGEMVETGAPEEVAMTRRVALVPMAVIVATTAM